MQRLQHGRKARRARQHDPAGHKGRTCQLRDAQTARQQAIHCKLRVAGAQPAHLFVALRSEHLQRGKQHRCRRRHGIAVGRAQRGLNDPLSTRGGVLQFFSVRGSLAEHVCGQQVRRRGGPAALEALRGHERRRPRAREPHQRVPNGPTGQGGCLATQKAREVHLNHVGEVGDPLGGEQGRLRLRGPRQWGARGRQCGFRETESGIRHGL